MTPQPEDEIIRKRQRERAKVTAILLGLFVVLMFAITIAKMTINQGPASPKRIVPSESELRCSAWRCSASPSPLSRSTGSSAR